MAKLVVWSVLLVASGVACYSMMRLVSLLGLGGFAKLLLVMVGSILVVWTLWDAERIA